MVEDEYFVPVCRQLWELCPELGRVMPRSSSWKDMKTVTLKDSRTVPYAVSFEKTDREGARRILAAWKKYYEAGGLADCAWVAEKSSKLAKTMRLSVLELLSRGYSVSFAAVTGSGRPVRHTIRNLDEFDVFPWKGISWCEQYFARRPSMMRGESPTAKNRKADATANSDYYIRVEEEKREDDRYMFRLPGTASYISGSPSLFQLYRKLYPGYDFQESRIEGRIMTRERKQPVKVKDGKEARPR